MNPELWIALSPILVLAALLHFMPLWRRQNLWFGVTVPEGFRQTPEAKGILHQFRIKVWAVAAISLLTGAVSTVRSSVWLLPIAILFLTFASIVVFAMARNQTRAYSIQVTGRSAPLTPDSEALPGGPAISIGPFGILLAAAVYLEANWQGIPEKFPVHWGLSGAPDAWADKSGRTVFGPLVAGAVLNLFLLFMGEAILRYSPRARIANTAEWTARFRRINVRLLVVVTWGVSLMLSWFAILPLVATGETLGFGWLAPLLLIGSIVPFVWQLIRLSQEPGTGSDGTPDCAWKLGQFYYNPDDPALLVEKRFGIGYTLNFGNRASWWLLGLLALPVVLLAVL